MLWRLIKAVASFAYWLGVALAAAWGAEAGAEGSDWGYLAGAMIGIAGFVAFAALSLLGRRVERGLPGGPGTPDPLQPSLGCYLLKGVPVAIYWVVALFLSFPFFFGNPAGGSDGGQMLQLVRIGYLASVICVYALLSWGWNRAAEQRLHARSIRAA